MRAGQRRQPINQEQEEEQAEQGEKRTVAATSAINDRHFVGRVWSQFSSSALFSHPFPCAWTTTVGWLVGTQMAQLLVASWWRSGLKWLGPKSKNLKQL